MFFSQIFHVRLVAGLCHCCIGIVTASVVHHDDLHCRWTNGEVNKNTCILLRFSKHLQAESIVFLLCSYCVLGSVSKAPHRKRKQHCPDSPSTPGSHPTSAVTGTPQTTRRFTLRIASSFIWHHSTRRVLFSCCSDFFWKWSTFNCIRVFSYFMEHFQSSVLIVSWNHHREGHLRRLNVS